MIWDSGTVESIKKDDKGEPVSLEKSYDMGRIEVELHGKKLKGGYNIVRMKGGKMRGNWLLMKQDDKYANSKKDIVEKEPKSSDTGRSLEEIAKGEKSRKQ